MLPSLDSVLTIASLDPIALDTPPEEYRQRLLSLPLGTQGNSLLPLEAITEILRINVEEILTVPETPSCVLGAYNWRGNMLWLVDLDRIVGCPSLFDRAPLPTQPIAIVVTIQDQSVGLVVRYVNDIELHDLKELLPARQGLFPSQLLPFLKGYFSGGLTVLNLDAIAQFFASLAMGN